MGVTPVQYCQRRGTPGQVYGGYRQNTSELVQSIRESTATYSPANTSQTKCPMCGKPMLAVNAKKGSKLVCSDKRCGYEEFEKGNDTFQFKRSKKRAR
jgi:ssDNA-binding Zn-finger/Zn-ribbon topoisomerase 1